MRTLFLAALLCAACSVQVTEPDPEPETPCPAYTIVPDTTREGPERLPEDYGDPMCT